MSGLPNSLKFFLAAACVTWCACSAQHLTGGTSTSENARVKGRIVDQNGAAVGGVRVLLLPVDYDPVKDSGAVAVDTTDASGDYVFTKIITGVYSIQALDMGKKRGVIVRGIQVSDRFDTLAADTVRAPGSVKIAIPASVNLENGYMYIPGTTFFAFLKNNSGFVTLDSVPGTKSLDVYYSSTNSPAATIFRYGVRVNSGDTAVVWNFGWNYSRTLTLNTTASGADVAGSVTDFPALIRLTAANFDFTQAKNNGEDIRFTKQDNTFLSYEIERWDPIGKKAEIWVKVDTIHGGDSAQSITMYWGNADAVALSLPAAVFDTAAGFAGVWHLCETDSLAPDATGNHYDGTGYSTTPVAGMIGKARHFNGNSSIIRMKGTASSGLDFPLNGRYTLSAWVYHDTLADSITYLVAGKGEHQYFIKNFDLWLSIGQHARQWEFTEYHDNDWQSATFVPATAQSWVYLVGVRDGSNEYLYVNGILAMNKMFAANQGQLSQDTSDDFAIGGFLRPVTTFNQGGAYFRGVIDEVTVSSTPRSADWVKLNYMNQKEKDALLRW